MSREISIECPGMRELITIYLPLQFSFPCSKSSNGLQQTVCELTDHQERETSSRIIRTVEVERGFHSHLPGFLIHPLAATLFVDTKPLYTTHRSFNHQVLIDFLSHLLNSLLLVCYDSF